MDWHSCQDLPRKKQRFTCQKEHSYWAGMPTTLATYCGKGYSASLMCAAKISRARADQLVYEQGLAESREQAKRLIMAGQVLAAVPPLPPARVEKPGHPYTADTVFSLTGQERFVSRGAYKLLTALELYHIDVTGMVCLDAGASTGGFTDCLLQHGAAR